MKTYSIKKYGNNIDTFLNVAILKSEPILNKGKQKNFVLVSFDCWKGIAETLFQHSIPKMQNSIIKGMKLPLAQTISKIKW